MKRVTWILIWLLCISAYAAEESSKITCTGRVIDVQGEPIANSKVTAYEMLDDMAGNTYLQFIGGVATKADGAFVFEAGLKSKRRWRQAVIVAAKEGLAIGWATWDMHGNTEVTIELGEPEKLEGAVVDEIGQPIEGAEVQANLIRGKEWLPGISPLEQLGTRTNDKGRFQFNNIPADCEIDLLVTAPGRATICNRPGPLSFEGPQSSRFKPGQTDITFVLPREGRIEGRVVDRDTGQGLAGLKLKVLPTFASGLFYYRFFCVSGEDGSFSIGALQTGEYLIRGDFPRTHVDVESGRTTKDVIIECAGVVMGHVADPNGKPIANVEVQIRGGVGPGYVSDTHAGAETNERGYYHTADIGGPYRVGFVWRQHLPSGQGFRHQYMRLNQVHEGTQTVDFQFKEFPKGTAGLVVQVVDQHGTPVTDFAIDVRNKVEWKDYSTDLYQYGHQVRVRTADGTFKVTNLPAGVYWINTYERSEWKGYAFPEREQVTLEKGKTLRIARKVIKKPAYYGRVLFEDGSPAIPDSHPWPRAKTYVSVSLTEHDQVSCELDNKGYFTTYLTDEELEETRSGKLKMTIYYPSFEDKHSYFPVADFPAALLSPDKATARAVKIPKPIYRPELDLSKALPLARKPLPAFEGIETEFTAEQVKDKSILVCFFDMNQRPSRHMLRELAKRATELKEKGLVVCLVQASPLEQQTLDDWVKKNNIGFPVGMIEADEEQTRFAWGVKSLPWLILTDKEHVVTAEGFGLSELYEKTKGIP